MYTTRNNRRGDLFPQIDRVLNEIFNTTIKHATDEHSSKFSQPSANVKEFNDRFEIYLAVPGFEKSDISVKVEKDDLSIAADRKVEDNANYKLKEFKYGKFERKFKLPKSVDKSAIDAAMENGILTLKIAKRKDEIDNGPKDISIS